MVSGLYITRVGKIRILTLNAVKANSSGVFYTVEDTSDRPAISAVYAMALYQPVNQNYVGYAGITKNTGQILGRYFTPGGASQVSTSPAFSVIVYSTV